MSLLSLSPRQTLQIACTPRKAARLELAKQGRNALKTFRVHFNLAPVLGASMEVTHYLGCTKITIINPQLTEFPV